MTTARVLIVRQRFVISIKNILGDDGRACTAVQKSRLNRYPTLIDAQV